MQEKFHLPMITLLLLISFASVNAVMFTPALPAIAVYFSISEMTAQQTITWFLIGYALGQLIYGPVANRFGRKPAMYGGIAVQIASSLLCVYAGMSHNYPLLVASRFALALGSGVGLKMTYTIVNESYSLKVASQKISYLMLAFAITPGLATALGGILNSHFGWMSCFYAGALYGLMLLPFIIRLPETLAAPNRNALKLSHLWHAYGKQFSNKQLVVGALLMGMCASFVYVFTAVAPFVAINIHGMSSAEYGVANVIPPIGLIIGSLLSARLINGYRLSSIVRSGIMIATIGVAVMFAAVYDHLPVYLSLFMPTAVLYFGIAFILPNASSLAMSAATDKAHASAVMNFIAVGVATVMVLSVGWFAVNVMLLPIIYGLLCLLMMGLYGVFGFKEGFNLP